MLLQCSLGHIDMSIMGIGLSVACSVLPSRLLSIGILKAVTSAMILKGVFLDKLLNSQSNAPS